MKYLDLPNTRR